MNSTPLLGKPIDFVMLGWVVVWNTLLSAGVVAILTAYPGQVLPEQMQPLLGICMGGLSAGWSMLGTWAILIDLPSTRSPGSQRMIPRFVAIALSLVHFAVIPFLPLHATAIYGQILLTVALSLTGVLMVFLWTRSLIGVGSTFVSNRRSIAQIMNLTLVIAVAIAMANLCNRWLDVSTSVVLLVCVSAFTWLLSMSTMLGHRWGWVLVTIPLVLAQVIGVLAFVDALDRNSQGLSLQLSCACAGFYLFSIVYLMLMRSSGCRWNCSHKAGI